LSKSGGCCGDYILGGSGASPREMANRRSNSRIVVNSEISCKVQHVLEDLIVVKFVGPNNKEFQGVLLDSSKRNIPFGINPVGGFSKTLSENNPRDYTGECAAEISFPTVSRRHTYFQDTSEKQPINVPSGKNGKSFLSQDKRLGVRLRARQVLCSKCSSICNEKGENVKESSRREKEGKPQSPVPSFKRNSSRNLRIVRPQAMGRVTNLRNSEKNENSSSTSGAASSKPRNKVRYFGMKKRKGKGTARRKALNTSKTSEVDENCSVDQSETFSIDVTHMRTRKSQNVPELIIDLDDKSKRLAKRNSLVPKVKRLALSEIERYSDPSNSDRESCSDSEKTSRVSSSTEKSSSCDTSMQPLKLRLSSLTRQASGNTSGLAQYSIVKQDEVDCYYRNSDSDKQGDAEEASKRICDEEENQPLKKVLKKDCGSEKPAPVLKISFGRESTVLTVSARNCDDVEDDIERDNNENCNPSTSGLKPNRKPDLSSSKAAKRALKRAKKEAQKRSLGLVSPGRPYISKSPHNLSGYSPYRPSLPSPAAGQFGGISPGNLSPGQPFSGVSPAQHLSGVSPGSSSRFSSPAHPFGSASPAYTLLCPSSQKLIIKKVKKKKRKGKEKEKINLDETPCSSTIDEAAASMPTENELPSDDNDASDDSSDKADTEFHDVDDGDVACHQDKPGIAVESALLSDGHTMCVGDVVWAKAEGNPWWPGKILNLMMMDESLAARDDVRAHAQISWYNTTSSTTILPCTEVKPFLESYEVDF